MKRFLRRLWNGSKGPRCGYYSYWAGCGGCWDCGSGCRC